MGVGIYVRMYHTVPTRIRMRMPPPAYYLANAIPYHFAQKKEHRNVDSKRKVDAFNNASLI